MFNNWTIGRPFGIRTSVHWSFWLLPLMILAGGYFGGGLPMAVVDTFVVLTVFGCIGLHELGHALAARLYGIRTRDIVLYPIGGVATLERLPRNPGAEIVVALAGPAVNIVIATFLAPLMWLNGYAFMGFGADSTVLEVFWTKVLWANVFLAAFNMIPAFPMDGGRVFRAFLSLFVHRQTATEIAVATGTAFAVLFGVAALLGFGSPMLIILAAFLFLTGQSELAAVRQEGQRRGTPFRASVFDRPAREPAYRADGWEYDPQSRMWTFWHNGLAVKRVRAIG